VIAIRGVFGLIVCFAALFLFTPAIAADQTIISSLESGTIFSSGAEAFFGVEPIGSLQQGDIHFAAFR
jgi:hypothetical protein